MFWSGNDVQALISGRGAISMNNRVPMGIGSGGERGPGARTGVSRDLAGAETPKTTSLFQSGGA